MEDDYNHVSEELVYCLTNVPGPGLVGGIPADIGGCSCTTNCSFGCPHLAASPNYTPDGLLAKVAGTKLFGNCRIVVWVIAADLEYLGNELKMAQHGLNVNQDMLMF